MNVAVSESGSEVSPVSHVENFRSRLVIGTTVVLVSNLIFALADVAFGVANIALLWVFKGVQIVEIIWVRRRLRRNPGLAEANFLGVLMVSTVILMTTVSGYVSDDRETTPILGIGILFASAGLVPWSRGSQLVIGLVTVASISVQQLLLEATISWSLVAVWGGAACSVLMANLLDHRRRLVEDSERVARYREKEEREINEVLMTASTEVVAGLGQANLLNFFCVTISKYLDSTWAVAIETRMESSGGVAVPVAQQGIAPGEWQGIKGISMDRSLDGLIHPHYESEIAQIAVPSNPMVGSVAGEGDLSLLLLRLRGSDDQGVVLTAWRSSKAPPFGVRERRIARGLVPLLRASLEQRRLLVQLEEAQGWQQNFLASLSHELRTPLNIILGYMDMLLDQEESLGPAEIRELQSKVKWNATNQLRLVNEALELSRRDEAGGLVVRHEVVVVSELTAQLAEEAKLQLRGKPIDVLHHFPTDLRKMATDPVKLRIILGNLLDNARKFTVAGRIELRVVQTPDAVLFQVEDTGAGIAENLVPELFRAFRQGERGDPGGLGLGLYIVQRLVRSLGGEVRVESKVGVGSVFTVEIPQWDAVSP